MIELGRTSDPIPGRQSDLNRHSKAHNSEGAQHLLYASHIALSFKLSVLVLWLMVSTVRVCPGFAFSEFESFTCTNVHHLPELTTYTKSKSGQICRKSDREELEGVGMRHCYLTQLILVPPRMLIDQPSSLPGLDERQSTCQNEDDAELKHAAV